MNVIISQSIIENPEKLSSFINYFIFKSDRHTICTENVNQILLGLNSRPKEQEVLRNIIEKQVNSIEYSVNIELTIKKTKSNQETLETIDYPLSQKSLIILENSLSDRKFIELVLSSTNQKKLLNKLDILIEFVSLGGCGQIPQLIDQSLKKAKKDRVYVVHDSDKAHPTAKLSKTITNIINKSNQEAIQRTTLKRREIENYICDSYIISHMDHNFVSIWKKLSRTQKDYYDFKYGFSKKPYTHNDYCGLFSSLTASDADILHRGFGEKIAENAFEKSQHNLYFDEMKCNKIHEFNEIKDKILSII
jgi:hypothetical protein